ncbi:PP2C family protein-serine/threonine phosphatase [Glycomyces luteolus]|uniref:PP2C family protein-serine/threonine phosphatase n=1 Tax=Glycomyces luteolus TaxID=2670330 RepID=A0A9X3P8H3_9ACTN|nr:PP2C family protein-serine/threonine phosphatase [Glycomyces luteolus]MDA1360054.1 PP2C family protein-serine/threonine phosphatase [Glycomyces luteolus]
MDGTKRGAADMQGYFRSYVLPKNPWRRIAAGEPGTVLLLRLMPFILIAVSLPIAFLDDEAAEFADYTVVLLPAFTALVNGPLVTAGATILVAAVVASGQDALGIFRYPESTWNDLPPVLIIGALCTALAWTRNRMVNRLISMTLVAEAVQSAILPELPARIGGARVAVAYRTHDGSPGLVGGDFYDVQETDLGIRAVVGDVQGHDLTAVQLTEALLGTFRERSLDDPDLRKLAARMERRVRMHNRGRNEWDQSYATAAFVEITPRFDTLRVLLCGHPAPLLVRGSAQPLTVRPMPPLGLADFGLQVSEIREVTLMPGDLVVMFSDGFVEGRNAAGETFPVIERLNAHVASGIRDPDRLHRKLKADFQAGGYERTDDLTVLIIQTPSATSP